MEVKVVEVTHEMQAEAACKIGTLNALMNRIRESGDSGGSVGCGCGYGSTKFTMRARHPLQSCWCFAAVWESADKELNGAHPELANNRG